MRIIHAKTDAKARRNIFADDNVFGDEASMGENVFGEEDPDADDTGDEDLDDNLDEPLDGELQQDGSAIDMDNNITNHLIAECQNCHGIFISAMIASDQLTESINGVCPLCNKDTEQSLKWVVKDYPEDI